MVGNEDALARRLTAMAIAAAALAGVLAACTASDAFPDWAFPGAGTAQPPTAAEKAERITLPDSDRSFTRGDVSNFHGPAADWRPGDHPPAPDVVMKGGGGDAAACGYCHLPNGMGRPENAALAGLPADYIKAQIAAFRSGDRKGAKPDWIPTHLMTVEARAVSDAQASEAADYFSKVSYRSHYTVVETSTVSRPVAGGFLLRATEGAKEPLGQRIVETPASYENFERRDPEMTFTAYVPVGSLARGKTLAESGGPAGQACSACHGAGLQGGEGLPGPPLAGRSPGYLFRQLYGFHTGGRSGTRALPMKQVTEKLSQSDMIALAAYLASLKP